ncbi:MAG: CoA pyrophosphatase [Chloroflexi bacterium]|nr:CoA pyrophosphatase [Chloroflexota bacterium]
MQNRHTITDIKQALALPEFDSWTAQTKMTPIPRAHSRPASMPGKARLGGVLVLLYCYRNEIHLVLTRRRDDLSDHAGQVSFPGGKHENGETFRETAVREAHEEIGVHPDQLTILGQLTPLYISPSDFEVHPTVAWYDNGERPYFTPSDNEVAEILETPLSYLLDPASRGEEMWTIHDYNVRVPFFNVQGHKVWGATAMMLSELVERLKAASQEACSLIPTHE